MGILDFYHAAQHLWKGAAAWLDGRTTQARRWFGWARHRLRHGHARRGPGRPGRGLGRRGVARHRPGHLAHACMRIWSGTASTSTMPRTRTWDCRWAVGWWRVPANGSSNNASKGSGCAGVRTVSTISCISDSPGSTDALRPCSAWPCPRTRNCARSVGRTSGNRCLYPEGDGEQPTLLRRFGCSPRLKHSVGYLRLPKSAGLLWPGVRLGQEE